MDDNPTLSHGLTEKRIYCILVHLTDSLVLRQLFHVRCNHSCFFLVKERADQSCDAYLLTAAVKEP